MSTRLYIVMVTLFAAVFFCGVFTAYVYMFSGFQMSTVNKGQILKIMMTSGKSENLSSGIR